MFFWLISGLSCIQCGFISLINKLKTFSLIELNEFIPQLINECWLVYNIITVFSETTSGTYILNIKLMNAKFNLNEVVTEMKIKLA